MCVKDTRLEETKGPSYPLHPDTAPLQGISNKRWLLGQGGAVAITSVQLPREEAWDAHEGASASERLTGARGGGGVPSPVLPLRVPRGDCMQEAGYIQPSFSLLVSIH